MWEIVGAIVGAATPVVIGMWAVLKFILPNMMKMMSRRLEHSQNQEIKHLEAKLQLHSTALINSLQIASQIGEKHRNKTIDAVEALWKDVMRLERQFSPLVAVETILTENEMHSATRDLTGASESIKSILEDYSTMDKIVQKMSPQEEDIGSGTNLSLGMGTHRDEMDELRPFVTDRLWRIYRALTGVHGRFGFLVSKGIDSGELVSWKNDPHMASIVAGVLPDGDWDQITSLELSGFKAMTALLEQEFILEARRSMRGSDELAETVSEVGQISDEEEAKARYRRELFH